MITPKFKDSATDTCMICWQITRGVTVTQMIPDFESIALN